MSLLSSIFHYVTPSDRPEPERGLFESKACKCRSKPTESKQATCGGCDDNAIQPWAWVADCTCAEASVRPALSDLGTSGLVYETQCWRWLWQAQVIPRCSRSSPNRYLSFCCRPCRPSDHVLALVSRLGRWVQMRTCNSDGGKSPTCVFERKNLADMPTIILFQPKP